MQLNYKKKTLKKKSQFLKIIPAIDKTLEPVFSKIGTPEKKKFEPDEFQTKAVSIILKSKDCLVTAPTGSGKTWIAEKAITHFFENNQKAWFASPLKALSNSIYLQFAEKFGINNVGILTGDRVENANAPIIVGTTEILRNQLYDAMHKGIDITTDLVVIDEAHFLGDEDRGVVWEEILIYMPVRVPILLLSATIGNANKIAAWLQSIRGKECFIIKETKREVSLFPVFFHPSGTMTPFLCKDENSQKKKLYKKVLDYITKTPNLLLSHPRALPPVGLILKAIKKYNLLPAIFFLKSRIDCNNALDRCSNINITIDQKQKTLISKKISEFLQENPTLSNHKQLFHLEHLGVGAHHSGQLPAWKILIESLMAEGLLNAVFATSTMAAGVNFPARTVVILNTDRYNGRDFVHLSPTEFHQMTGRAGRRGKDNIGFGILIPGKFMDLRLASKLINSPSSKVYSQICINFSMVLNLLLSHTIDGINDLLKKSFASYTISTNKKKTTSIFTSNNNFLWQDFLLHLNFLKKYNYVNKNNKLTKNGKWASKLRINQPLIMAESFKYKLFNNLNPSYLAGIVASFVNERNLDDDSLDMNIVPIKLLKRLEYTKTTLTPFLKYMDEQGFETKKLYLKPAVAIYLWAENMPWSKVLSISELAEGDLARLIFMTVDNLRHIKNLIDVFPQVADNAGKAINLIYKDPLITY